MRVHSFGNKTWEREGFCVLEYRSSVFTPLLRWISGGSGGGVMFLGSGAIEP